MQTIIVTDRNGECRNVAAEDDIPLMYALREAGLPVEGTCGGNAMCGSCHVLIADKSLHLLLPPQNDELALLEELKHYDARHSRLACQLVTSDRMDGLSLTLAPEELI
jgi:2Fe-2S ferredoxin